MKDKKTIIFYISSLVCVFLLFSVWYIKADMKYDEYITGGGSSSYAYEETLSEEPETTAEKAITESSAETVNTEASDGENTAKTVSDKGSLININTADAEELQNLPKVGEALAERIIKYREENGGFKSTEEIMNVEGIGEKTYEKLSGLISAA